MRLIDADALKEKLRGNAQKDGSPFVGVIVKMFCDFLDQAPDAEKRGEVGNATRWIPVTERLPENCNEDVLVTVDGVWRNVHFKAAQELAVYSAKEGWILQMFPEWDNPPVTHWMPLPEPPELE